MANRLLEEFYQARKSQQDIAAEEQQSTLRNLAIQTQRQQLETGSPEQLERKVRGAKASTFLENMASINAEEKQARELKSRQDREDLIAQRIYSGEDGQSVIDEQEDLPKGVKFSWIKVGDNKIAGFTLPGEDTPQPITDKDREDMIAHSRALSLAKAKEKDKDKPKPGKRPDLTAIKNIKALAAGDEDLADIVELPTEKGKESPLDSFATLVANRAQKAIEEAVAAGEELSWDEAVDNEYEYIKQRHIKPGKTTGWFDLELDEPASFSKKPLGEKPVVFKEGKELRRQTNDGKIAIFDKATKKFLRYE